MFSGWGWGCGGLGALTNVEKRGPVVWRSFWSTDFRPAGNFIYIKRFASKAVYRLIYSDAMKQVERRYKWELIIQRKNIMQ